jgi:protein-disulfide isomerase
MPQQSKPLAMVAIVAILFITGCGGSPSPSSSPRPQPVIATGTHVLGNASAKVTIVKFCDFQCPYCKTFHADTEWQIINDYVNTGKASIAFRHFPLTSIHANALLASNAAECAGIVGGEGTFWKYHDLLYTNGTALDPASLKQYAADLQLDTAAFNSCLDLNHSVAAVSTDISEGATAGVSATPTFFINGKKIVGAEPYSTFKAAIDAAQ